MKKRLSLTAFFLALFLCFSACDNQDSKYTVYTGNDNPPFALECQNANLLSLNFVSTYSDNISTIFEQQSQESCLLYKIESPSRSETYITYRISNGEPYQFYVVSAWIKVTDIEMQKPGNGISIMVDDPSDYNCAYVFSDTIDGSTITNDYEGGWVCLKRVVKLDDTGCISIRIQTGWSNNKSKGSITIDQISVIPIADDSDYRMMTSEDGKIRMVFRTIDIMQSAVDDDKLQKWLDVYSELRSSMKWLVGEVEPYEGTTDYILTEHLAHYGLAGNPIYINVDAVQQDLEKIELDTSKENNNIIWGYIHEMGHTFDGVASETLSMRWVFDAEFFATLKCVFSLYDNGYGMGNDSFIGDKIVEHFEGTVQLSTGIYSYEGFLYRLLNIISSTENDGWDALHETFIAFNSMPEDACPVTDSEKFNYFINTLSEKSGIDIQKHLTEKEWSTLMMRFK